MDCLCYIYRPINHLIFGKMGKVLAIDYGLKRCGIAITDDLQMIASPHSTVNEIELVDFLIKLNKSNNIDAIVIGLPIDLRGKETHSSAAVKNIYDKLKSLFPSINIILFDERFTSGIAAKSMIEMNLKKSKRKEKGILDQISATIILQDYLNSKNKNKMS